MAHVSFVVKIHQMGFSSGTTVLNYLMHHVCWLNKHNFISSTKTVREQGQLSMTESPERWKTETEGKKEVREAAIKEGSKMEY